MSTAVVEETVCIPAWVVNLESFRQWARSDEFPEQGRIAYLNGGVWVDMSKEQLFSHNQVKNEYAFTLTGLAKKECPGRYFPDGVRLSDIEADVSNQPDGVFVSLQSLRARRVRLIRGTRGGYVELEGTPDMALEVISPSSVQKDTVVLRELYWRAGIPEFWLVDARGDRLVFDILRHTTKGYVAVRKQAGWIKSKVFDKSFRLSVQMDELGYPEYTLSVR